MKIILETKRLVLREMEDDDFAALKAVISDPENMIYYPKPYDDEGVRRWIAWCKDCYVKYGFGLWAVVEKSSGEMIGDCGLSMQMIDDQWKPEIGYHLRRDRHRLGLGKEMTSAVRDYFFTHYPYNEVYSYMEKDNVPSYKTAEANGMTFRHLYLSKGENLCRVYSITREEWEERNKITMDAFEMLLKRRSIRKFKAEQIKDEELEAVLKAGTYAPTAMGLQSPFILAVQNKEDVEKINELNREVLNRGGGIDRGGLPYYGAPTIIIVFSTKIARNDFIATLDAAAVTTNMLNAAYAMGLGSVWINRSKEVFESEEGKKLLKKWGIEEELTGIASIALGYADCENPAPRPRREGYCKIIK